MKTGRKISGGRYKPFRKKRKFERKRIPVQTLLGKEKKKKIRIRGGKFKVVLFSTNKANVINPTTKKCQVAEIKNVIEVPSNKFLAKKNVLVKGAVIETTIGKAKITSRPNQDGQINAVLIE